MAKVGSVFRFVSRRVAGSLPKPKFHIAIDLNCGFFLFVNSDAYEGAMEIGRGDWPEMPKTVSYISCNAGVRYSRSDLQGVLIEPSGTLTLFCLGRLRHHIADSLVMPQQDITIALAALDKALE